MLFLESVTIRHGAVIRDLKTKYECTIDQNLRTTRVHSPDGSTFLREMTSRLPS